jgi:hypothetical protein
MKAETADPSRSKASTAVSSPETASVAEQTDSSANGSQAGDDPTSSSTVISTTLTVDSASSTGKAKKRPSSLLDKKVPSEETQEKSTDLVGKINNLVSTDLNNIVDGRDFLLVSESVLGLFVVR